MYALKKSLTNNDYSQVWPMKEAVPLLEHMPMRLELVSGWHSH